jgi:hypothetical protein
MSDVGLIPFDEVRRRLRVVSRSYLGVRSIPVDRIVGSVDRKALAAALTTPLAAAGVAVLLIATYDTGYLLVRGSELERALAALAAAGDMNASGANAQLGLKTARVSP